MNKIVLYLIGVFACIVVMLGTAWIVKVCWNVTMPYLFGLPTLTYWKAYALEWLVGGLFGKISPNVSDK